MQLSAALSIYSPANRRRLLIVVVLMVVVIAAIDWWTEPYLSLGFLYLFPIMIAGGFLSRTQIVGFAVLCALLQEPFSNLPRGETWPLLILSSAGFIGTGLFIFEVLHNRRMVLDHLNEVETQVQARREAEEQLQVLVESSPAAIVTLDADGTILLANEAAQQMLASGAPALSRSECTCISTGTVCRRPIQKLEELSHHSAVQGTPQRRRGVSRRRLVFHLFIRFRQPSGRNLRRSLRRLAEPRRPEPRLPADQYENSYERRFP